MNFRVIILILLLIFALGEARRRIRGGTAGAGRRSGAGLEVVGRGIASFAKSMTDDEEMEEQDLISGKEVKAEVNTYRYHSEALSGGGSILIIVVVSLISVGLVIWFLVSKKRNVDEEFDYARMRQTQIQRDRSYKLLKTIAEHGVHPARATGEIYRIKL